MNEVRGHWSSSARPRRVRPGELVLAIIVIALACGVLLQPRAASGEQLPIKTYTTADGLPQDNVNRIVRDSQGFLWFCTGEGLSRFDGYQFTSYTTEQGLPHRQVNDLLETRSGEYWVATNDGLCRFNLIGPQLFTVFYPGPDEASRRVESLAEGKDGTVWCGTNNGIYRFREASGMPQFEFQDMGMPSDAAGDVAQAIIVDRQGAVWAGTRGRGLYRRSSNGQVDCYTTTDGLPGMGIVALLEDRDGAIWVGTTDGLARLTIPEGGGRPKVDQVYSVKDGLASRRVLSLLQTSDGVLWLGTTSGLSELLQERDSSRYRRASLRGPLFRNYSVANGLSSPLVQALAEDRAGNIWLGTDSGGAMRFASGAFTSYTENDGLAASGVDSIFEDISGQLCVISSGTTHPINRFDGRGFTSVLPAIPKRIKNLGWGWNQITFQDHLGEWWVPTGQGLCRFPAVARVEQLAQTPPKAIYTTRDGLPQNEVFRLFEDSKGDIWISTISAEANGLCRWERSTQKVRSFSEADGLMSLRLHPATAFCEDASGNLWIGYWGGGLSRYRDGRFTNFDSTSGLPEGTIRSIYMDHAHRLWLASAVGGVARLDHPEADRPRFVVYTAENGLSSDDAWCITEGGFGRIYIGTGRGLYRLDPETGHVKHYTTADGLMRGKITSAFRDRSGALWFGSNVHGLSRLIPRPDPPESSPPILIRSLHIAGVNYPLSQLGAVDLPAIALGPSQNQLNISYVSLSFGSGQTLRYQYELEGADKDWSAPSDQRSVNYANLAPGRYRFLVRAVDDEGVASSEPATIQFTILPPMWRRRWFLILAAMLTGMVIYTVHRARVARLVELERVRTRIATDLHDDIGANLSLIAMLSEVAPSRAPSDDPRIKEWLSTIAATSRDTVDAMSDIVWAVNPKRDQLRDLTQRMRRFAEDILGARNIEFGFRANEPGRDLKLGADFRREVFLIFKESINNIVRHSQCTAAEVELEVDRGWLTLKVSDNGKGCHAPGAGEGNGLASIQGRAQKLGGSLELTSANGCGTSLILRVPLGRRGFGVHLGTNA